MKEMTDLYKMLEQLHEVAVVKPRSIGSIAFGLQKDEIAMQIAKIRASLPKEVRTAENVAREKDRIVDAAHTDATQIMESAERDAQGLREASTRERDDMLALAQQERANLVAEHEIVRLAKVQAEEIRNAAEQDASLTRRGAEDYAFTILQKIEGLASKIQTSARDGMNEINHSEPQPPLAITVARDAVVRTGN